MADPSSTLERLVKQARELYSLPRVAMEVLELTSDPQVDARRLKQCIENDPALCAKIMRVVNSSLFGLSRHVCDLNQALALLGTKPLKLLVLGFSLPGELFANMAADVLARYWQETLVKAVAAREISRTLWHAAGDEAFLAALLQDLGMLVLIQDLGEPYLKFLAKSRASDVELSPAERKVLGFDHRELTVRLLQAWNIPPALIAAVSPEHAGDSPAISPTQRPLVEIVELAGALARALVAGRPAALAETLHNVKTRLPLSMETLQELVADTEPKVAQLAEVLALTLPDGVQYSQLLAQARSRLIEVAAEVAGELVSRRTAGSDRRNSELADSDEARLLGEAVANRSGSPARSTARGERGVERARPAEIAAKNPAADSAALALESLDEDPGLTAFVASALATCRPLRQPVSLLLVEIDRYSELLFSVGAPRMQRLVGLLQDALGELDHSQFTCLETGDGRYAAVLPHCDRQAAVQQAQQLLRSARRLGDGVAAPNQPFAGFTLSIGVAAVTAPGKGFLPAELIHTAERCLFGAQASGGNAVKSIEVL